MRLLRLAAVAVTVAATWYGHANASAPAAATPAVTTVAAAPASAPAAAAATPSLRQQVAARQAAMAALVAAPPPATSAAARLEWITRVLDTEQKATRWYHWGFFTGFGGVAAIQGGMSVALRDQKLKDKGLVGAAAATIGFGSMVLAPTPRRTGSAGYAALPATDATALAAKLAAAERRLESRAKAQQFATSWLSHAGALLVSSASAGTIYFVFDQTALDAAVQFVSGFAVGQTKIWITPQGARRAWAAYQANSLGLPAPVPVSWQVLPARGGVAVAVRF